MYHSFNKMEISANIIICFVFYNNLIILYLLIINITKNKILSFSKDISNILYENKIDNL
jgi:hypothetical protein